MSWGALCFGVRSVFWGCSIAGLLSLWVVRLLRRCALALDRALLRGCSCFESRSIAGLLLLWAAGYYLAVLLSPGCVPLLWLHSCFGLCSLAGSRVYCGVAHRNRVVFRFEVVSRNRVARLFVSADDAYPAPQCSIAVDCECRLTINRCDIVMPRTCGDANALVVSGRSQLRSPMRSNSANERRP